MSIKTFLSIEKWTHTFSESWIRPIVDKRELSLSVKWHLDHFPQIEGAKSTGPRVGLKKLFKRMIKAFNKKYYSKSMLK